MEEYYPFDVGELGLPQYDCCVCFISRNLEISDCFKQNAEDKVVELWNGKSFEGHFDRKKLFCLIQEKNENNKEILVLWDPIRHRDRKPALYDPLKVKLGAQDLAVLLKQAFLVLKTFIDCTGQDVLPKKSKMLRECKDMPLELLEFAEKWDVKHYNDGFKSGKSGTEGIEFHVIPKSKKGLEDCRFIFMYTLDSKNRKIKGKLLYNDMHYGDRIREITGNMKDQESVKFCLTIQKHPFAFVKKFCFKY